LSGDQTAQLTAAVLMLVLVGSSLVARRMALADMARIIAGWLLIFALLFVGYSYRDELREVWQRVTGNLLGDRGQTVGETLRVAMAEDGHFWVRGQVNGVDARFLIDSGATTNALSSATARGAGLVLDDGFPVVLNTANGSVRAQRTRIERLSVGPLGVKNMAAVVSPAFGETNLLGMNFLSSLKSWRVEGRTLVLEPHTAGGDDQR
jgi:aspartyl protease family protein